MGYEPPMEPSPRGRPRAEPRDEQRDRIIRAARRAFTELGYDAATLSGIAREANVPRPVVYELVGGKEDLLGAVADVVADELIACADARFSDPDEVDRPLGDVVRDDVRWFIELIAGEPSYSALLRQEHHLTARAHHPGERARRRIEDRLTELHVSRGRLLGVEREGAARVLAALMLALIETVAVRAGEPGWPADGVAALVGEFALGGYVRTEVNGAAEAFEGLTRDDR